MISKDIEKYLKSDLHVHKNGAFLILNSDKNYKESFPENKTISDIVLQMNSIIIDRVKDGSIEKKGRRYYNNLYPLFE